MFYNKLSPIKQKKAAIEMSIGTIVIIVIAMTMLIMGIVLVRNIFGGATSTVTALDEKVKGEITNLFAEEGSKLVVRLGSTRLAKVKQGTSDFAVAIGAKPSSGGGTAENLMYEMTLIKKSDDCMELNNEELVKDMVRFHEWTASNEGPISNNNKFEDFEGSDAFSRIRFNIPEDLVPCTQNIRIKVKEGASGANYAQQTFSIQVVSKGIFS